MTETQATYQAGTGLGGGNQPLVLAAGSWEAQLVAHARVLRQRKKTCMISVRFDGLAFQLMESCPVMRIAPE